MENYTRRIEIMIKKLPGGVFRMIIKLIMVVGAWWLFVSGIWGHDITMDTFDHCFRFFTIICCLARISFGSGKFNETGALSWSLLVEKLIVCAIGVIGGYFLYTYVVKLILIFLGKLIGGLIVVCLGLYFVLAPTLVAYSYAADLVNMGADNVRRMIYQGDLKLNERDDIIKGEVYSQTGVDYDEERERYENEKRRNGW